MNSKNIIIGIVFVWIFSTLSHSQSFEGKVIMKITSENFTQQKEITFWLKHKKMTLIVGRETGDQLGIAGKVLTETGSDIIYILNEAAGEKVAMKYNIKEYNPFLSRTPDSKSEKPILTHTKETKDIKGYKCKKTIAENSKFKNEMWITKEANINISGLYPMFREKNILNLLGDINGFLMESFSTDKNTGKTDHIEMYLFPEKVDDTLVNIPPDYKTMDMNLILRQMIQSIPLDNQISSPNEDKKEEE